ncbi:MAG: CRISPR-associated helicase Cas3' [Thermoanaerobacteraceae bacterium]|nr:CRISPR-associated helicase Cas3' [Thermoanaerobacteraceae bacterium]
MNFFSHVERGEHGDIISKRELKEHLTDVANSMCEKILNSPVKEKEKLSHIGHMVGLCHDFGKFTTYFQDYLLNNAKSGQKKNHGFISALFSSYQVKRLFKGDEYLPLFVYFMVLHHHGDLKNLDMDLPRADDAKDRIDIVKMQIEDISKHLDDIKSIYSEMDKSIEIDCFIKDWEEFYKGLNRIKFKYLNSRDIKDEIRVRNSINMLFVYSTLIDSDKKDAGRVKPVSRMSIPGSIVDGYRQVKFSDKSNDPMTAMRNEIYNSVINNIKDLDLSKHILTITAPTGSGKTIAGFSAAVKLRERLSRDGYLSRIIYALPFTSIIDQNYKIIHEILKSGIADYEDNESLYLVKHHHLADVKYMEDKDERPVDEALALIEAWESEVVVTTFIQFFYTLIGYRNRMLKKYHNIAGSIVILDEVQNIPMEYWDDIGKILKYASELLDIYIILMTATRPLLFVGGEYEELVDEPDKYFKDESLNRVCLYPRIEEMDLDLFTDDVVKNYDPDKSYLIVMNTVGSSLEVFEKLKEKIALEKGENLPKFIYLSANIVPYQRRKRIEEIKDKLKTGKRLFIVSTQVVEAGVDIDLDVVIRDIGPFDSIMQVAGRCNRENKGSKGEVYVYNLIRESGRHYYERVYKKVHCLTSKEILENKDSIDEKHFIDIINDYFVKATERSASTNDALVKAMGEMKFDDRERGSDDIEYISDFKLIDELPNYADVFIETNDDVEITIDGMTKTVKPSDIWEYYKRNVVNMKDIKMKRENNLKIKKYFREFVISINAGFLPEGFEEWPGLYRIPNHALDEYYDEIVGFKRVRDESIFA